MADPMKPFIKLLCVAALLVVVSGPRRAEKPAKNQKTDGDLRRGAQAGFGTWNTSRGSAERQSFSTGPATKVAVSA